MKIQSMKELEAELRAVARGEKAAPRDAAEPSIESIEALMRLLTADNRRLMKIIRDKKPQSVAELAKLAHRAEPNLLRTLAKLQAVGLIEIRSVERRKVPVAVMGKLHVEIDPYGTTHRFKMS
jgi:predicted transcriptional regulator